MTSLTVVWQHYMGVGYFHPAHPTTSPLQHTNTMSATQSLIEALNDYHELNITGVEEVSQPPTPLEFSHCLHLNLPVVIRGGVSHWKAVRDWDSAYLRDKMGAREITVAETPFGCVFGSFCYFLSFFLSFFSCAMRHRENGS